MMDFDDFAQEAQENEEFLSEFKEKYNTLIEEIIVNANNALDAKRLNAHWDEFVQYQYRQLEESLKPQEPEDMGVDR